ncbi:DEAD/DEAH box helicase [Oceanobacillus sp. M60]|uniref:UvrABC system protein B n=1 Tax=Oceanobacillus oncorhynchi TaxID=545501 RepID=A0A0A1MN08_9BACI|nr:DEAD/DEAH box helicase [Oceanobacillus oncorhynchi]UUI39176.1 DEAD/DEAH box helicase [Oceanobacillus oncorhynchi]CEI81189.1 UvrABC system protein B [Oceanobacillus oncorhynchi]
MDKQIPLTPALLAQALSGKRLLEDEVPIPQACFQVLRSTKQLIPIPAIENNKGAAKCTRCGNTAMHYFSEYSCGICQKTHLYCRNCIQMGRISECKPLYSWNGAEARWPVHANPLTWEGQLTPAQSRAAAHLEQAVNEIIPSYLCWAVCGAGKTEMLFPAITAALKRGDRVALASPRVDVIRELLPRMRQAFQNITIEALYGGSEQRTGRSQLILATTHQLLRYYQAFDVLIIDEVDAFPYYLDRSLMYAAKQAVKKQATTLYLTATPRKNFRLQMKLGKLPHVFVPLRYHGHLLPVPKFKFSFYLTSQLTNKKLPHVLLKWLTQRKNPKRQLLLFVPEIVMAKELKEVISTSLLETNTIAAAEELEIVFAADQNREEKINQFREKKLHALITTTILERGVTFPSVDVVVLGAGHEVFNEAALVQIAGRAGRSADDPSGEVIFFHDGKTYAMEKARQMILDMNARGRKR